MLKFDGDEDGEDRGTLLWSSTFAFQWFGSENVELNCCSWCGFLEFWGV